MSRFRSPDELTPDERETLSAFRASVRNWSDAEHRPSYGFRPRFHNLEWMVASVLLLISISLPFTHDRRVAMDSASDILVLNQIEAGISRSVPQSMEPLIHLVSWEQGQ